MAPASQVGVSFHLFPEALAPALPVMPSPARPPEGQLRLPHGNAGLGRALPEHSIRKGLGCCLLPLPAPGSSRALLHPLTRPRPSLSVWRDEAGQRAENTEPRANAGTVWVSSPLTWETGDRGCFGSRDGQEASGSCEALPPTSQGCGPGCWSHQDKGVRLAQRWASGLPGHGGGTHRA